MITIVLDHTIMPNQKVHPDMKYEYKLIFCKSLRNISRGEDLFQSMLSRFLDGKLDLIHNYDEMENWFYTELSPNYYVKWRVDDDGNRYEYDFYIESIV